MTEQTEITKEKYQQALMVGDFNIKIGNHIPGNKAQYQKEEDSKE